MQTDKIPFSNCSRIKKGRIKKMKNKKKIKKTSHQVKNFIFTPWLIYPPFFQALQFPSFPF